MVSPRKVTLTPIGTPLRSLKLEMSFLETVATAFCPLIVVISLIAPSINFLSDTASPIPWLRQILVILGTCIELE